MEINTPDAEHRGIKPSAKIKECLFSTMQLALSKNAASLPNRQTSLHCMHFFTSILLNFNPYSCYHNL